MHFKWAELTFSLIGKSPECKAEPSHTAEIHMLKYLLFFFFFFLEFYSTVAKSCWNKVPVLSCFENKQIDKSVLCATATSSLIYLQMRKHKAE